MLKVLLIGSTGFVGRHISEALLSTSDLYITTRNQEEVNSKKIFFDFLEKSTWQSIIDINPDIVINSAGYGVVKEEEDLEQMYDINYRSPMKLISYLQGKKVAPFWIQIGTAFEYDLDAEALSEVSSCQPLSHYGISKLMCSLFLQSSKNKLSYLILRPFAMFGPYESESKFLPYIITAQKNKKQVPLSSGKQIRDYFYVKDLAIFIKKILTNTSNLHKITNQVINLGSNLPRSIKELALEMAEIIPGFNDELWDWGKLNIRNTESKIFFNASSKAYGFGFTLTPLNEALANTVSYYFNSNNK